MTSEAHSKSVPERIYDWSLGQSLWKRDALRRVFQNAEISDANIDELVAILENEQSNSKVDAKASVLEKSSLPNRPKGGDDVKIVSITEVDNVNRLASNQTLEFGRMGITVIFGNNGSGKSGYSRILKSACTARHRSTILPNIYNQSPSISDISSTITYQVGDAEAKSVIWGNSEYPHEELSAVSVFDRQCSEIHIGNENEVSVPFRPLGLDIPEKLVDIYKRVEGTLKQRKEYLEKFQNAIFTNPAWKSTTSVGEIISNLSHEFDIEEIQKKFNFSEDEEQRLKELKELLATNPEKQIKELNAKLASFDRLKKHISTLEKHYSQEKLKELKLQIEELKATRKASIITKDTFEKISLNDTGSNEWKILWDAARKYSTQAAYPEKEFPYTETDAVCVLCQQPIEADAKKRMASFEAYVKSDTESRLRKAAENSRSFLENVRRNPIRFKEVHGELDALKIQSDPVYRKVIRHLAKIRCKRSSFIKIIAKEDPSVKFVDLDYGCLAEINEVEKSIQKSVSKLNQVSTTEGRSKLASEKDGLVDKQWANNNLEVVKKEIRRLKDIYFLQQCIKDTKSTAVTNLGNTLADEVITPQLQKNFLKEITGLVDDKFRVEIVRSSGRAGAPKYKVQLVQDPKEAVPKILSEGEQTCVGIASFFAELATSEHNSSLILDDPISSLDHKWRARAAKRLVKEASRRQVVVFTHDLIFLNDLEDAAKQPGINFTSRHIKSSPNQAGLVDEVLPWEGMKINARIDAMEKNARQIQTERNSLDDETYKRKAGDFYSDLRASWERALEEVGLSHTVMRHRDYINSKNVRNLAALNRDICVEWSRNYGRCCDFTKSHDTSLGHAQELPEPDVLLEDVKELSTWTERLRKAHKEINKQEKEAPA